MIYCSYPKAQYLSKRKQIDKAILTVLNSGNYILGKQVTSFEKEFSQYIGVKYGIGVSSGTDALFIALKACGIGKGDEVITVSHTAVATVAAIMNTGATPVLVDIDPDYYTLNPELIKKAFTKKTKAIIPVHIYGQSADMDPICRFAKQKHLFVIEDCAQAHGATYFGKKVGSIGHVGCFSFYPTKNLGAIGDAGMIVTNNTKIAKNCILYREYGWKKRYISSFNGYNTRLDEIQAAILKVKLHFLDKDNKIRNIIAQSYLNHLVKSNLILPSIRKNCLHVFHLFVIRSSKRNLLIKKLKLTGIIPLIHYPIPIHLQPAYKENIKVNGDLTITEKIAKEILSLPIYPELKYNQSLKIINTINNFYE